MILLLSACGKDSGIDNPMPPGGGSGNGGDSQFAPIDETVPGGDQDPGFFLDNWMPKQITDPVYTEKEKPTADLDSRIQIDLDNVITKVPDDVYGNNANTYNSQMADQPVLVNYVSDLNPHLIRFPGGSLSDTYFWDREPNNPPDDVPPAGELLNADGTYRTNEGYWYGKNNQSYTMSLDNYYQFLDETNSKGVITLNYGYARYGLSEHPINQAAHYAADWVRYDHGRTKFWEIGNEDYGDYEVGFRIDTTKNKDGQPLYNSGKLYGQIAKAYIDSMRAAAQETGADIKIGTQLIEREAESYDTETLRNWNTRFFEVKNVGSDYYIVHNYYTPYEIDSPPFVILNSASSSTKDVIELLNQTTDANGAELKPVALTEWNIFAGGSRQKISDIAGMHAAMTLGNIIKYRYGMACRWDLANAWEGGNDHGMFNSGRSNQAAPDAPAWNPRPAFYHMYYFQKYFGDRMVWSGTQGDTSLKSFASIFTSSGQIGLVVANTSDSTRIFDVQFKNSDPGARYYWYTLSGGYSGGQYSRNLRINGQGSTDHPGGPDNYNSIKAFSAATGSSDNIKLSAPPYSVLYILIDS